jgi:hypothetical protein
MNEQLASLFPFLFWGVLLLGIVGVVFAWLAEKKRCERLQSEAGRLGLSFDAAKNRDFAEQYKGLNRLDNGHNRYAYNVMRGNYRGGDITVFDYHYQKSSSSRKGNKTRHYYVHVYLLRLPKAFPELIVGREDFLTRMAKNFGFPSIDFESHEFSKRFLVQSPDKKFAYDICHARMIEYLMENQDLAFEIEGDVLALVFEGRLKPGSVAGNLDRLLALRELFPRYLLED